MNGTALRPYSKPVAYLLKFLWAAGERVFRVLLLNRCAPRVAGVERGARYVPGGHRLQSIDVFKPPGKPPWPVLVYFHGGAQHVGDKRTYDRICKTFAHEGYLVFNANYRMAPRFKFREQWQDAAAAVKWAYESAAWYGGDNSRLFLGGDSAGGSLSSAYAVMSQDEGLRMEVGAGECLPTDALRGLLLFYGVYDCRTAEESKFPLTRYVMTGYLGRDPEVAKECMEIASPLRHVLPGFPSCYLATSEVDPLHPETLAFKQVLEENGVEYQYLNLPRGEYPHTQHGFLNFWPAKGARLAMRGAIDFLRSHS
jgi:acetyl esterase/lipase